jgi:hypothetical protein
MLVIRFTSLFFHENISLYLNYKVHFYKCCFHFRTTDNLKHEQNFCACLTFSSSVARSRIQRLSLERVSFSTDANASARVKWEMK